MERTLEKIIEDLKLKENESLVLFLDDSNGWYNDNPLADLVVVEDYDYDLIKSNEMKIPGVYHRGGNWKQAVADTNLNFRELISSRKNDYVNGEIVKHIKYTYEVISGNY